MSEQNQFNDPVLDRTERGLWWHLRRPFVAVFYKANEDVSRTDVLAAVALYIGTSAVVIGGLTLAVVMTAGVGSTTAELAAIEPFEPSVLISSFAHMGMAAVALLPIIALLKFILGMRGEQL